VPAEWLNNSSDFRSGLNQAAGNVMHGLAQPRRQRQLRNLLILVFALWGLAAVARLVWVMVPDGELQMPGNVTVVNPVSTAQSSAESRVVDIEQMQGWHLFGEADAKVDPAAIAAAEAAAAAAKSSDREGIEKGARQTRLDLILRGAVSSSDDGLGHAIIEHQKRQAVYRVEDKLPVAGEVILAKVMNGQVVLDNGGTYELLKLFDESEFDQQVGQSAPPATGSRSNAKRTVENRGGTATAKIASNYRNQLYQNPQSLANVVQISAVREGGLLKGYRVRPGRAAEQFTQLGFETGDLVTGVNGIALDNPANTMRLYQVMRTASEAVFELERSGQPMSLAVSLDDAGNNE
jgi:general secretion pathway protein C